MTALPAVRRDDIQGLRALAVLSVMVFHATNLLPGGFVGVDIFFVISGCVITLMLAREHANQGRISLARFYVRRFKRLTPALALVVSVTLVGSALILSPIDAQQTTVSTARGALLLVANFVIMRITGGYFGEAAEVNPLLHTWSLSVEEQFYLLFPALLTASWVLARRRGRWVIAPFAAVATAGAISFVITLLDSSGWLHPSFPEMLVGFYGPATRVWEFAVGSLLALGSHRFAALPGRLATALAGGGLAGLLASGWLITSKTTFPGPWTLLPVLAAGLLLMAGFTSNPISRLLASAPMVRVGDLSYSLYLWHWPLIVFASLLWPGSRLAPIVAVTLSCLPAWASYRFLEQPVRALQLTGRQLIRLIALTLLPPFVLAALVGWAARHDYWSDTVTGYRTAIDTPHEGSSSGCADNALSRTDACTWNRDLDGTPIYLVGDSNGDHFSEAMIEAGRSLGRPVQITTQIGCTYLDVHLTSVKPWVATRCNSHVELLTDRLLNSRPGTVVIANSYLWWNQSSGITVGLTEGDVTSDPTKRLAVLEAGLERTVLTLQQAGHQIIVVQPVPQWGDDADSLTWAGCSVLRMLGDGCRQSFRVDEARQRQGAIWTVLNRGAGSTGATLLDVSGEVCPDETCESVSPGGMVRYRDGTHLSVAQSQALAASFRRALG